MTKILLLILSVAFAPHAFAQSSALGTKIEVPEAKVGDNWTYVVIDRWTNNRQGEFVTEVTSTDEKLIHLKVQGKLGGRTGESVQTLELNTIKTPFELFSPHDYSFSFPLEVGKSWKGVAIVDVKAEKLQVRRNMTVDVLGWEKITVPAGPFDALKIEKKAYYTRLEAGGWSGTQKWTYWYAPEVRRSVRIDYEDTTASGSRYNYTRTDLLSYQVQ